MKENPQTPNTSEIVIYQTEDGKTKIDVRLEDETVWLSQAQIAELFETTKQNISLHLNNAIDEGELDPDSVVKDYLTTAADGKNYQVKHYNLDAIISVGYRVKSLRGTQFRKWATALLKEYMVKGFTLNDAMLKQAGGGDYWHELLDRIRDIRSSEKDMQNCSNMDNTELYKLSLQELWQLFPIEVVGYNPCWPEQYEAERTKLVGLLGRRLARISHIGSTSVPGLDAKAIIDILAELEPDAPVARRRYNSMVTGILA
jgi:hypothetical protein